MRNFAHTGHRRRNSDRVDALPSSALRVLLGRWMALGAVAVLVTGATTGCSAVSSLLSSDAPDLAEASSAAALVTSCATVTSTLAGVSTELASAQTAIAHASTQTNLRKLSAADLKSYAAIAKSAGIVSDALEPLPDKISSDVLTPEVTNLANSMAFFENYFAKLSKKSKNLPSAATAKSAASTAASSSGNIVKLCAGE